MLRKDPSAISKWVRPLEQGGCGGRIPNSAKYEILSLAATLSLDVKPDDFYYGRTVPEDDLNVNMRKMLERGA